MSTEELIAQIKQRITKLEADKVDAQDRLDEARANLRAINSQLYTWYNALSELHDKGSLTEPVNADYTALTPRERVDLWSSEHKGILVVADLALVLKAIGVKPNYKAAYASVRASVLRRKDFEQIEPGVYRRIEVK